jgi:hypothetical protein
MFDLLLDLVFIILNIIIKITKYPLNNLQLKKHVII